VHHLAKEGRFAYLLIESTGISEPLPVAATFTFEGEDGKSLKLTEKLEACLLTDDEFYAGPGEWENLPDLFPRWPIQAAAGAHHEHGHLHADVPAQEEESPRPGCAEV